MKTKDLTAFLTSMSDSIEEEEFELYRKIIEGSEIPQFDSYSEFYIAVLYPFEKFIRGFIKSEIANNDDVVFIITNSRFIENNFQRLIEDKEGMGCCADKSRTIMMRLIDFYTTGNKIVFNYEAEYTFHLPKTVFKTHDHIVMFYEGLKSLWHGNNQKYLQVLLTVLGAKEI